MTKTTPPKKQAAEKKTARHATPGKRPAAQTLPQPVRPTFIEVSGDELRAALGKLLPSLLGLPTAVQGLPASESRPIHTKLETPPPPHEAPITAASSRLHSSLDNLGSLIARLTDRLTPVLSIEPEAQGVATTTEGYPHTGSSGLTSNFHSAANHADWLASQVSRLLLRLELPEDVGLSVGQAVETQRK